MSLGFRLVASSIRLIAALAGNTVCGANRYRHNHGMPNIICGFGSHPVAHTGKGSEIGTKEIFPNWFAVGKAPIPNTPTHIVDDKRMEGNILEQIEEGMLWFKQRFATELIITGKPTRDEKWEYPLPAVREALINAVCHRNTAASNTQVRL